MRLCSACGEYKPGRFITATRCLDCGTMPRVRRHEQLGLSCTEYSNLVTRLHKYRLTPEAFISLMHTQNGNCALCNTYHGFNLHVGHCHISGKVRALLCCKCNTGLGQFNEDPNLLAKAITYLSDHKMTKE